MLSTVSQVLISSGFTVAYCGATFLAFLYIFWRFRRGYNALSADLFGAIADLSEIEGEKAFPVAFSDFHAGMQVRDSLRDVWNEYKEQLLHPASPKDEQIIHNSREAAFYFNDSTLVSSRLNMRFYGAVPNYLTGAGIWGTFLGLSAGVYLASKGLSANDIESIKMALSNLLGGASLAFLTSVIGLFLSILFSGLEKKMIGDLLKGIDKWNLELDRRVRLITAERISHDQLGELKRQTGQLERFNTDLAVRIGDALGDRMNQQIVPSLARLVSSIDALRTDWKQINVNALESMLGEFSKSLTRSAGTEFQAMSETLTGLNATLGTTTQSLSASHDTVRRFTETMASQFGSTIARSTDALEERLSALSKAVLDRFTEASDAVASRMRESGIQAGSVLETSVRRFGDGVELLRSSVDKVNGAVSGLDQTIEGMRALSSRWADLAHRMDETIQPIIAASNTLQSTGGLMESVVRRNAEVAEQMGRAAGQFKECQELTSRAWSTYQERFEGVDASLKNVFIEFDRGLTNFAGKVNEFMVGLDGHLSKGLESLSAAITDLGETAESLEETLKVSRK